MYLAGLRSLALQFPSALRTNQYFLSAAPALVLNAGQRSLAKAFSPASAQPPDLWTEEMLPYLADPFRGTVERRVLAPGEPTLLMQSGAARAALAAAGISAAEVDLLMVTSLFPAHPGHGDAAALAQALGLRCGAWNLESMCVGLWICVELAAALLRAGLHRRILLVTSCSYSRATDEDDTLSFFVGDGAAAMVLDGAPGGTELLGCHSAHTGDTLGVFYVEATVDGRGCPRDLMRASADVGRRIPETVTRYIRPVCDAALAQAGLALGDVDFFIFNTPTAWYHRVFARALGVSPDRTLSTYPRYGNCSTILSAANLYHAVEEGRVRPGDRVLVFNMGYSSNAVATLLRWGDTALGAPPPPAAIID